jgi:hypothetical protein
MTLMITKDPKEINTVKYQCEFCNKEFIREKTLLTHSCETKNRWLDKDKQGNRIGYQTFLQFYKKHTAAKKTKPYEEFIKSPYYIAFIKFGNYCININCVSVSRYVDWLLKENIKLDNWASDVNYTKFLIEYLRIEDPFDAIHRTIEYFIDLSNKEQIQHHDVLRFGNKYKICHGVTSGKVSPWVLFHSKSGVEFLDALTEDQVKMVIDYIDPQKWALKFHKEPDTVKQVKELLDTIGL